MAPSALPCRLASTGLVALLSALAFAVSTAPARAEMVLVSEGRAETVIRTMPPDSADLLAIATTLGDYLQRMGGAALPVNPPPAMPGEAGVPANTLTLALTPDDADLGDPAVGAYRLQSVGDTELRLAGGSPKAVQDAAYDLLRRLGVRWLQPGERWTVVPQRAELRVPPLNEVARPAFRNRDIWYAYGLGIDESKVTLGADYTRWCDGNRLGGVGRFNSGHTYPNTVGNHADAFREHPEYFAMNEDGQRLAYDRYHSLCYSNPDVANLFIADKLAELRDARTKNPFSWSVSMDPNDGSQACYCEPCKALGNGSDQTLYLANQVAAALRAEFPGAVVSFYVYASHRLPPERVKAEPNVYVQIATAFNRTGLSLDELASSWGDNVTAIGVRDYLGVEAWDWGLPGRARGTRFAYVREAIPRYLGWGAVAYNAEMNINWGSAGPATTLAAALLWEPSADPEALYAAWFRDAYGPAAAPMRALYDLFEDDQALSRTNLHRWFRQLESAFTALDQAAATPRKLGDGIAVDGDSWTAAELEGMRARLADIVILLHYCRLYADWELAAGTGDANAAYAALEPMLTFTWRARTRGIVHAYGLQRRLVNSGAPVLRPLRDGWRFNDPDAIWKDPTPITDAELMETFAADLLATPPDTRIQTWSKDLVVMADDNPTAEPTGGIRGESTWEVAVPKGSPLTLDLQMTGVRFPYRLTVFNADGNEVHRADLDVQATERYEQVAFKLPVKLPEAGRYKFRFRAGEDYRPSFPDDWAVSLLVSLTDHPMLRFYGPATIYVPAGTERVLLKADGRVTLQRMRGWRAEDFEPKDADPELDCLVVPVEGDTPQVWRLLGSTSANMSLLNIPPYLGRLGMPMLVPADALPGAAPAAATTKAPPPADPTPAAAPASGNDLPDEDPGDD